MRKFDQSPDAEEILSESERKNRVATEINRRFDEFCRQGNLKELHKILYEEGAKYLQLNDRNYPGK